MSEPAAAVPSIRVERRTSTDRDPWIWGGTILLVLLSVAAVQLYRAAPRTAAEAGARAWLTVQPDAFTPRMTRAEQTLADAASLRGAGRDSAAAASYLSAAEGAWEARRHGRDAADSAAATGLWARALLDRGETLLAAGAAPWWRPDDDQILTQALASVDAVLEQQVPPETRARAERLRRELRSKLRPGPLEWLPLPR